MAHPRVLALRADTSGCYFDRIKSPLTAVNRDGQLVGSVLDRLELADVVTGRHELYVGQRVSTAEMAQLWKVFLHPDTPACIIDYDDDLFNLDAANMGAFQFFEAQGVKELMAASIFITDAITVSTEPLAEEMRKYNQRVYVLPNYLPRRFLRRPRRRNRVPIIGWAGGSSHIADLDLVSPVLRQLGDAGHKLRTYGQDFRSRFGGHGEHIPWVEDKAKYLQTLDLDIGLCPLRGTRFDRSKSPVKALEYAFAGVATVASNVTPYREFIHHGYTGYLADSVDEWQHYIELLEDNPSLRWEITRNAYEVARQHTSEDHADQWRDVYLAVIRDARDIKTPKWEQLNDQLPEAPEIWARLYGIGDRVCS